VKNAWKAVKDASKEHATEEWFRTTLFGAYIDTASDDLGMDNDLVRTDDDRKVGASASTTSSSTSSGRSRKKPRRASPVGGAAASGDGASAASAASASAAASSSSSHRSSPAGDGASSVGCRVRGCSRDHTKHYCKFCYDSDSDHYSSICVCNPKFEPTSEAFTLMHKTHGTSIDNAIALD
jgi:hypothetical protein